MIVLIDFWKYIDIVGVVFYFKGSSFPSFFILIGNGLTKHTEGGKLKWDIVEYYNII